jgi:hypothetical protein
VTISEYKAALDALDAEAFEAFRRDFGGDVRHRQVYIDEFVQNPQHERRICQLLGLTTQEEKQTEAAVASAKAARDSATWARVSMLLAGTAILVSLVALALAMYAQ